MPQWLKIMLSLGLLIGLALLIKPRLAVRRRRQAARAAQHRTADAGQAPDAGWHDAEKTRIVLADYDRVVVTRSKRDDAVYVLRPPGQDPQAIMRAARLVLPEASYGELADQLGIAASWPMK